MIISKLAVAWPASILLTILIYPQIRKFLRNLNNFQDSNLILELEDFIESTDDNDAVAWASALSSYLQKREKY